MYLYVWSSKRTRFKCEDKVADILTKIAKEKIFKKYRNMINEGKMKYKTNQEYKCGVENESKEIRITNTIKDNVNIIVVDNFSRNDQSGHQVNNSCKHEYCIVI